MKLKDIYLFENLNEQQIAHLQQISAIKKFKKNNHLFFEGEDSKSLHILTNGRIKVYKSDFKGNEVVLNYFNPVSMIAELANLDHIPYPASAQFETDGRVIVIDYALFEEEFLKNPDVSLMIIKSLSKKLKNLDNVISHTLTMDSSARVARFIYENEELFRQLTKKKTASILNITPETMSRVLKKLKESEAIEIRSNQLKVLDKEKLKGFFGNGGG